MNHRDPRDAHQGGINRDFGARDYADTPSLTNRHWGAGAPWGDSFGPADLGGYGNFAAPGDLEHVAGGQAIGNVTRRALARRAGKGPRNAVRSDSLIAEELNERLTDDEQLDASEILVRVEDGHVLLTGEVRERWMKHRAEDIADAVRGVRDIENRLRVDAGVHSFGTGGAVRAGLDRPGSGFSSSPPNR
jgi:hypothetical protein